MNEALFALVVRGEEPLAPRGSDALAEGLACEKGDDWAAIRVYDETDEAARAAVTQRINRNLTGTKHLIAHNAEPCLIGEHAGPIRIPYPREWPRPAYAPVDALGIHNLRNGDALWLEDEYEPASHGAPGSGWLEVVATGSALVDALLRDPDTLPLITEAVRHFTVWDIEEELPDTSDAGAEVILHIPDPQEMRRIEQHIHASDTPHKASHRAYRLGPHRDYLLLAGPAWLTHLARCAGAWRYIVSIDPMDE